MGFESAVALGLHGFFASYRDGSTRSKQRLTPDLTAYNS